MSQCERHGFFFLFSNVRISTHFIHFFYLFDFFCSHELYFFRLSLCLSQCSLMVPTFIEPIIICKVYDVNILHATNKREIFCTFFCADNFLLLKINLWHVISLVLGTRLQKCGCIYFYFALFILWWSISITHQLRWLLKVNQKRIVKERRNKKQTQTK